VTGAEFVDVADDAAEFDCVTGPPLPGLQMRTGAFTFSAPTCVASDAEKAPWPMWLSCTTAWIGDDEWPSQPHGAVFFSSGLPEAWLAV
jgi:hypothetical protein